VSQHYVVCSDHFIASEFVADSKQRLKKRAIPTLFDFNSPNGIPVEIIDGDQIIVEGKCICVTASCFDLCCMTIQYIVISFATSQLSV
jgi:hypothetical protein